jgi:hypothetical protein
MNVGTVNAIYHAAGRYALAGDPRPTFTVDVDDDNTPDADAIAVRMLPDLMAFHLNGDADVSPQTATVHWLDNAARLVIPTMLQADAVLPHDVHARWLSVRRIMAAFEDRNADGSLRPRTGAVAAFVAAGNGVYYDTANTVTHIEANGDVVENATATSIEHQNVTYSIAYAPGDGDAAPPLVFRCLQTEPNELVMPRLAMAFQLNIDPRDAGALGRAQMRFADAECHDVPPLARFRVKLHAYTIASVAALNLAAVGGVAPLAVARAHGLAAGMLPVLDSAHGQEYSFVHHRGRHADMTTCSAYIDDDPEGAFRASMSIHAIFGGLHLSANHTYKAGDANLVRRGEAWLKSLRTVVPDVFVQAMHNAQEATLRTCSHPFGLASTYAVLRWGAQHNRIAEATAVRVNVLPPPAQRLAMLNATMVKIAQLPIGSEVVEAYQQQVAVVRQALTDALQSPHRYSALCRMYGELEIRAIPQAAADAMGMLAPMCAGFAKAFFTSGGNGGRASGIGLAQSLRNIIRDDEAVVQLWSTAFERYGEDAAAQGIRGLLPRKAEPAAAAAPEGGH